MENRILYKVTVHRLSTNHEEAICAVCADAAPDAIAAAEKFAIASPSALSWQKTMPDHIAPRTMPPDEIWASGPCLYSEAPK